MKRLLKDAEVNETATRGKLADLAPTEFVVTERRYSHLASTVESRSEALRMLRTSRQRRAVPQAHACTRRNPPSFPILLAKCERVCYSSSMKWAAGPLLFLGACRIHIALEANHRESPCGRRAEGTTQGARPSEEGWDRSQCRYKAQALWSHPAPLRFRYGSLRNHYGSITVPLQLITARYALLRLCYGCTTTGRGGKEKAVAHTIKGRGQRSPPIPEA